MQRNMKPDIFYLEKLSEKQLRANKEISAFSPRNYLLLFSLALQPFLLEWVKRFIMHSCSSLSHDRSKASSKASSPHSAI
jgi:hypothetical protein